MRSLVFVIWCAINWAGVVLAAPALQNANVARHGGVCRSDVTTITITVPAGPDTHAIEATKQISIDYTTITLPTSIFTRTTTVMPPEGGIFDEPHLDTDHHAAFTVPTSISLRPMPSEGGIFDEPHLDTDHHAALTRPTSISTRVMPSEGGIFDEPFPNRGHHAAVASFEQNTLYVVQTVTIYPQPVESNTPDTEDTTTLRITHTVSKTITSTEYDSSDLENAAATGSSSTSIYSAKWSGIGPGGWNMTTRSQIAPTGGFFDPDYKGISTPPKKSSLLVGQTYRSRRPTATAIANPQHAQAPQTQALNIPVESLSAHDGFTHISIISIPLETTDVVVYVTNTESFASSLYSGYVDWHEPTTSSSSIETRTPAVPDSYASMSFATHEPVEPPFSTSIVAGFDDRYPYRSGYHPGYGSSGFDHPTSVSSAATRATDPISSLVVDTATVSSPSLATGNGTRFESRSSFSAGRNFSGLGDPTISSAVAHHTTYLTKHHTLPHDPSSFSSPPSSSVSSLITTTLSNDTHTFRTETTSSGAALFTSLSGLLSTTSSVTTSIVNTSSILANTSFIYTSALPSTFSLISSKLPFTRSSIEIPGATHHKSSIYATLEWSLSTETSLPTSSLSISGVSSETSSTSIESSISGVTSNIASVSATSEGSSSKSEASSRTSSTHTSSALYSISSKVSSTVSATTSPTACGEIGSFTLTFDDIPPLAATNNASVTPQPVFSPYHHIWFSEGWGVVPPPTDPYLPSSGRLLLEFLTEADVPNSFGLEGSTPGEYGATGEIGVGPDEALSCFKFDAFGASLGCDSQGPDCDWQVTGLTYDHISNQEVEKTTVRFSTQACPSLSDCPLVPVTFPTAFVNLTGIRLNVTVDASPKLFWVDDLRLGWSDNGCEAGLCRTSHR